MKILAEEQQVHITNVIRLNVILLFCCWYAIRADAVQ